MGWALAGGGGLGGEIAPREFQHLARSVDLQLGFVGGKRFTTVVGQQACRLSIDQIAMEALRYNVALRQIAPECADDACMLGELLALSSRNASAT